MKKILFIVLSLTITWISAQERIIVSQFVGSGVDRITARNITDRFSYELSKTKRFDIVELEMIEKILNEQGFQTSGCVTDECAVEIGQMIGVSQIVAGSISKIEGLYSLNIRLIDVKTGKIIYQDMGDYYGSAKDFIKVTIKNMARRMAHPSEKPAYPKPKLPADLSLDIQFSEPSGNNYLDAEETGTVSITITNNGMGEAYAIQPSLSLKTSITGLNTGEFELIERLDPSSSKEMQTTISASQYISSETVKFEINISEHNGFDLYPPGKLTIQTKALVPPALALMDVGINDLTNYNGRIEPNEVIEATAIIQNRGQGLAKNVNISVHYGDKVFNAGNAETSFSLGNVQPNETKEISFSFFATRQAETDLPIRLEIKEARGRYDQTVNAGLSLNEVIKKATEVFVAGREQGMVQITDVDAISVDIEENIPKTGMKNVNGIAVVIGNREYGGDVPDVEFAVRDAEYVREYLIKTMGYRPGNIFYYTNATFSNMKVAFKKLKNAVKKEKSDVFIYYSGHGAPDSLSGQGFFVPVDADPTFIKETGYAVKDLYTMLNTLGSKSTTVVIDACFSGSSGGPGSANERMLLKRISPISIHIDKAMLTRENSAVFSSSTGVQVSNWYTEKKHSLFTYYFLKALQGDADSNKDKMLTLSEIKDYIDDKVPYMARRLNNRVQTPQLKTLDRHKVLVNY